MFDVDRFIADCQAAVAGDPTHKAVRAILTEALAEPGAVLRAIGEPKAGGIVPLHRSPTLTVLNVVWAPGMTILPHDHRMWAVIGVYTGREDNIFWRRLPEGRRIEAAGAKALGAGDVAPLGADIIHSITNPIPRLTGAIHVYGGDFFATPRSEWDPEDLTERPYDVERNMRLFERANTTMAALD